MNSKNSMNSDNHALILFSNQQWDLRGSYELSALSYELSAGRDIDSYTLNSMNSNNHAPILYRSRMY